MVPASAAADAMENMMRDTAATDPQTAYTLRLHAEVATEAVCMNPLDGETDATVAGLSRRDRAAFCRCFAWVVVRNAPPGDQMDLIDRQGVPSRAIANQARDACILGKL